MRATDALSKLEHLIPAAVSSWRHTLPLVDSGTRDLLEKHILVTATRLLGPDWERRLLLPPPPRKLASGALKLGAVHFDKELYPFGLASKELLQGLGIFGRSGAGKTNTVFVLLRELARKGIPFLFLDWKRTCRHLLPTLGRKARVYTPGRNLSPFSFNPLVPPPGVERGVYIAQLIDVLGSAYTLGDAAKSVLQQAIHRTHEEARSCPTFKDVERTLVAMTVQGRAIGWKSSALRAIQSLALVEAPQGQRTDQEGMVSQLTKGNTVLELDGLSQSARKFLPPMLLLWIFQHQLARSEREKLRLVVIVEEAHHLLYRQENRTEETLMNKMLRQCRELGIGFVIVDQHPHLISSAALGNIYTSICLNLKEPSDISRAGAISALSKEDHGHLLRLPIGQGIVKLQDRWPKPFLVTFPDAGVDKGAVSDSSLLRYSGGLGARSGVPPGTEGFLARVRRVRLGDPVLQGDGIGFLMDCVCHPTDPVRVRYKRLGLSVDRGNRAKNRLIQTGLIEGATVPVGRTRKLILRPTRQAKDLLHISASSTPESVEHEFWKQHYAEKLRLAGYLVEIEAPRHGGRADVVAKAGGLRIAVEIETGKSDVISNVRNCLRSKFDQVVVITTRPETRPKIEAQMANEGLLIRGRTSVCSGDTFRPRTTAVGITE